MVLTGSFALPGDRAPLPPSSADMFCLSPVGPTQLRELDASVGASGPHDFAVRCNISRPRAGDRSQISRSALRSRCAQNVAASTASLPNVCDDRETPLLSGRADGKEATDLGWRSTAAGRGRLARRANSLLGAGSSMVQHQGLCSRIAALGSGAFDVRR